MGQVRRLHGRYESTFIISSPHDQVAQNGFSSLAMLDEGFYGYGYVRFAFGNWRLNRSMYFTSSSLYALPYYVSKENPCLVVTAIAPGTILMCNEASWTSGNAFPVIEHPNGDENQSLLGTPLKSGYQSHYCLTRKDGLPAEPSSEELFDEIVLSQEWQVWFAVDYFHHNWLWRLYPCTLSK